MRSLHHLLRVRMRTSRYVRLKEIAAFMTEENGSYVSVSDIVRVAIDNWLQTHDSMESMEKSMKDRKR